jgi:hypothetical protein
MSSSPALWESLAASLQTCTFVDELLSEAEQSIGSHWLCPGACGCLMPSAPALVRGSEEPLPWQSRFCLLVSSKATCLSNIDRHQHEFMCSWCVMPSISLLPPSV